MVVVGVRLPYMLLFLNLNIYSMTQQQAKDLAIKQGLRIKEVTYGTNGYPMHLGDYAIIRFDTFEQAEKFAETTGGEIIHTHCKQGWHFVENKGRAFAPYSYTDYLSDLGDDYWEGEVAWNVLEGDIKHWIRMENIEELTETVERFVRVKDEIEIAEEDEVVLTCNNRYYETVKRTMMDYSEDTHIWAIGVLLPSSLNDDGE